MKAGAKNKAEIEAILLLTGRDYTKEHVFHPVRKWRFDYAIPAIKLAIEYHGHSGFIGGKVSGHSTIKGLTNDCEKLSQAMIHGWHVIAFTALHFKESERIRHKLTDPQEIIRLAIDMAATRSHTIK